MARLIKDGCEDNASFSALGRGLSLNFYVIISVRSKLLVSRCPTLSRALPYLLKPELTGFKL